LTDPQAAHSQHAVDHTADPAPLSRLLVSTITTTLIILVVFAALIVIPTTIPVVVAIIITIAIAIHAGTLAVLIAAAVLAVGVAGLSAFSKAYLLTQILHTALKIATLLTGQAVRAILPFKLPELPELLAKLNSFLSTDRALLDAGLYSSLQLADPNTDITVLASVGAILRHRGSRKRKCRKSSNAKRDVLHIEFPKYPRLLSSSAPRLEALLNGINMLHS
jgi:hypothetical protein